MFPKAQWVDLFENHVLGGAGAGRARPRAEVVYFHRAVKTAGRAPRRPWSSVPSPIYLLRSLVYLRLLPYADAVVTVAPRSSDGLLEATIAKGRGCKPRYMLWAPIRHFHTVVVIAVVVLYMMYGPPAEQQCVVSMYLARAFVVVALVMANGALN